MLRKTLQKCNVIVSPSRRTTSPRWNPTRRIDVAHVGAGAERAQIADRLKDEQTLAHVRTSAATPNGSSSALRSARISTKASRPTSPTQTLRALRDAGIIEHHGHGQRRIFDPLLRRYLQQLPGEARRRLVTLHRHIIARSTKA
jgi:hypothetical protein